MRLEPTRGWQILLVLLVWLGATPVYAGGLRSTDVAGRGGPADDSARGQLANPGTLGLVDGTSTDFDLQVTMRPQSFERAAGSGPADSYDRVGTFTVRAYPEFAHVTDLGTEWFRLGFGLDLPFRYASSWPTDGAQRYHSIFHDVTAISLTPAVGFTPTDWLNVGVSVSYHLVDYRSYRAFDFGPMVAREEGVDPESVPSEHPGNEGREYLDFTGESFGWSAGVALTPGDFRIGAAYQSPIDLDMSGEYSLFIPNNDFYERRYVQDMTRTAELRTQWPSEVRAGVAWEIDDDRELYANASWTHWGMVDSLEIDPEQQQGGPELGRTTDLNWNDTLEVRAGGRTGVTQGVHLNGEVGFETAAIPEQRLSAQIIDASKIMAAAGLDWGVSELLSIHLGYQHVYYLPRNIDSSELTPPGKGQYSAHNAVLNTGISYRFE